MRLTSSLTERTITIVLDALTDITTSSNASLLHMRRNSMQLSTIPSGVSP